MRCSPTTTERVMQAVRDGAETHLEVAAIVNIPEKLASSFVSNLVTRGRLVVVGSMKFPGVRPTRRVRVAS